MSRTVTLHIRRSSGWAEYRVQVPDQAYVLDALQAALEQEPNLVFRHACHHTSCGSCGMRINGREKLACATPIAQATVDGSITLEPLRNFPVVADLAVDVAGFFEKMELANFQTLQNDESGTTFQPADEDRPRAFQRYQNCIECGMCISACPSAATDPQYIGPAALAASWNSGSAARPGAVRSLVNSEHGIWRCHSAFECTEVCPADVAPATAIMRLRRMIIFRKAGEK